MYLYFIAGFQVTFLDAGVVIGKILKSELQPFRDSFGKPAWSHLIELLNNKNQMYTTPIKWVRQNAGPRKEYTYFQYKYDKFAGALGGLLRACGVDDFKKIKNADFHKLMKVKKLTISIHSAFVSSSPRCACKALQVFQPRERVLQKRFEMQIFAHSRKALQVFQPRERVLQRRFEMQIFAHSRARARAFDH